MGEKQKTERKERERERRAKVGNNNGQATHGARKPPGPIMSVYITTIRQYDSILILTMIFFV